MAVVYYRYDPSGGDGISFPRCPSKLLTGYDCPGCGSQRALHALLHGDIAGCFRMNAIFLPLICVAALLMMPENIRRKFKGLYHVLESTAFPLAILIIIILWTIIRNV